MLNDIYTSIKARLTAQDIAGTLKGIEWYNVQYESTIATTPRIFVEFPDPLLFGQISKDARRAPLKVRLHVVTQAIAGADGVIPDTVPAAHETVAVWAKNALDKFTPVSGATNLSSPLQFSVWQHFHKFKGWMVTFVEFDCRKML